jgi:Dimethlysulfonioproprionate lyase
VLGNSEDRTFDGKALVMMFRRSPELQRFLDLTRDAIAARVRPDDPAAKASGRIFAALGHDGHAAAASAPARLPACAHLQSALANAQAGPVDIGEMAKALAVLEPGLSWRNRAGASLEFAARHANALIVGPQGMEPRSDVWIGVSLMAPDTAYPDHRHPPEEIYLVLSHGDWRVEQDDWHEPGIGGLVYNPCDILHSMRSGNDPLLAVWCLWAGEGAISAAS